MPMIVTSRPRRAAPSGPAPGGIFRGRDYATYLPKPGAVVEVVGKGVIKGTYGANTTGASGSHGFAVRGTSLASSTSTGLILPDGAFDLSGRDAYSVVAVGTLSSNNLGDSDASVFRVDDDADYLRTQIGLSFYLTGSTMEWHSLVVTNGGVTGWTASVVVGDTAPPVGRLLVMATRWTTGSSIESMWSVAGSAMRQWVSAAYYPNGVVSWSNGGSASQLNAHIGGMTYYMGAAFPGDLFAVSVLPFRISDAEAARVVADPFTALLGPVRRPVFFGPSAGAGTTVSVPLGAVSVAGYAPTVTATANQTISVPVGAVSLAGYAPTISTSASQAIAVPAGAVTLAGYAPTVTATANQAIAVPAGAVSLTGYAPSVFTTAVTTIAVPSGVVSLAGFAPSVSYTTHAYIDVPKGAVTLTGYAPTVTGGESSIWTPVTTDSAVWSAQNVSAATWTLQ